MRKLRVLIAGLTVTTAALAVAVPGTAKAANYNNWITANGLCMGVMGGNMNPGTAIISWPCDNSLNQDWSMDTNSGAPNTYLLRNGRDHTECLSVLNKSINPNAPLVIWPCKSNNDNQDQRWYIADAPQTQIINFNSQLQIAPAGGQGWPIEQWNGRASVLWSPIDFVSF
jgi:hypothetical protein